MHRLQNIGINYSDEVLNGDHVSDLRLQSSTIRAKEWILKVNSAILAHFAPGNYSNVKQCVRIN